MNRPYEQMAWASHDTTLLSELTLERRLPARSSDSHCGFEGFQTLWSKQHSGIDM